MNVNYKGYEIAAERDNWMICNPTQYCKDGIIIHTYCQNLNESVKEHNED